MLPGTARQSAEPEPEAQVWMALLKGLGLVEGLAGAGAEAETEEVMAGVVGMAVLVGMAGVVGSAGPQVTVLDPR